MSIADKLKTIAENEQKVYDAGAKSEYDRFWDTYQQNGKRTGYSYAFTGVGWTDDLFKPKYDIEAQAATGMFQVAKGLVDVVGCLEKAGVTLNTDKCTIYVNFANSATGITRFPPFNMSKATGRNVQNMFGYCYALKELQLYNCVKETDWYNAFLRTDSLTDLEMTGEIGYSISFQHSPLSKASIINVLSILSADVTGQTATFKKSAVDAAFETSEGAADGSESDEWAELMAQCPTWTIATV